MAQKPLKGVGGVLGGLISPTPSAAAISEPEAKAPPAAPQEEVATQELSAPSPPPSAKPEKPPAAAKGKPRARLGRPPGKKTEAEPVEKEKLTLRLNMKLADDYRNWSWEERCQLGELIERAMIDYQRRHRKTQSQ